MHINAKLGKQGHKRSWKGPERVPGCGGGGELI